MGSSSSIAASTHINTDIKLVFKTVCVDMSKEYFKQMTVPIYTSYIFQYHIYPYNTTAAFTNKDIRNTIMFDYIHSDVIHDTDSVTLSITNITHEAKSRIFTEKNGIISLNTQSEIIYNKKQNGAYYIKPSKTTEDYSLFLNRFLPLHKISSTAEPFEDIVLNSQQSKKNGRMINFYEVYGTQYYFNFNHENYTPYEGILLELSCTKEDCITTYRYFLSTEDLKNNINHGMITLSAN